jgi:hypothetical protein
LIEGLLLFRSNFQGLAHTAIIPYSGGTGEREHLRVYCIKRP